MPMVDPERTRKAWLGGEEDTYKQVAHYIEESVKKAIRAKGITCRVESRCKALHSILTKAVRREYADPLGQMGDKAGVRAIVHYRRDLAVAEDAIRSCNAFRVVSREDKQEQLGTDHFSYQSIHFDLHVSAEGPELIRGRECELQLRTLCQHAWADIEHTLGYKASQPTGREFERRLKCLVALLEIADREFDALYGEVLSMPGYGEENMLRMLESEFHRIVGAEYDHRLSVEVISSLKPLLSLTQKEAAAIGSFIENHADFIQQRIDECRDVPERIFVFQPEGLLLFYLLSKDMSRLEEAWCEHFDRSYLEDVAVTWGTPLPEG
jgi:ppGpp synthetase/RelA/SpoT-type nucleotidyltranferase